MTLPIQLNVLKKWPTVESVWGGVHVPKTIDNDLALPFGLPTFGYQTARHIGVEIVKNIMVDAQTHFTMVFCGFNGA